MTHNENSPHGPACNLVYILRVVNAQVKRSFRSPSERSSSVLLTLKRLSIPLITKSCYGNSQITVLTRIPYNFLLTACAKMFADDTNLTISGSATLADLEQETNSEVLNLHCWLKANKLSLNSKN